MIVFKIYLVFTVLVIRNIKISLLNIYYENNELILKAKQVIVGLYFTNERLFTIVSLLLYTGARISEICRIKLGHIDYNERFFFIERVKSKKNTSRWGVYFFPEFFIGFLKEWVAEIILEDPKATSLFPSPRGKKHLSTKTPRKQLRELKNELGLKLK